MEAEDRRNMQKTGGEEIKVFLNLHITFLKRNVVREFRNGGERSGIQL